MLSQQTFAAAHDNHQAPALQTAVPCGEQTGQPPTHTAPVGDCPHSRTQTHPAASVSATNLDHTLLN